MIYPLFPLDAKPTVVRFETLKPGDIFQFTGGVYMVIRARYVREGPRLTNDGLANCVLLWPDDKAGFLSFVASDSAVYVYPDNTLTFRDAVRPVDRPTEQADSGD